MSAMGTAMMGTASATGPDRAQEAAEAAISSPLLEDVDLTGAKGILVNITAGMDITIEEFEVVGNHVKALASENATVVVGAVIDPEMSDELRVTVVATGLGGDRRPQFGIIDNGMKQVSGSDTHSASVTTSQPGMFVPSFTQSTAEQPSAPEQTQGQATQAPKTQAPESKPAKSGETEKGDYFDIPAFLRKQSD
jgi:cell division protein FtsZ